MENPNEPGVRMMILNEKMQPPPKVSESIAQIMKFVSQRCKMNPQELKWRREEKAERHGKGAERHRQKICRQAAPVWRIDGKIWHLWVCSDSRWTGSPLENGAMGVHVKARGRWADEVKFTSTARHSHAMLWCPLGFFFLSCLYPTKDFGKCVFPSACEAKFHASF